MEASGGSRGETERFEVDPSPETAASAPQFEGANVCRVAALSTMLGGDGQAVRDLAPQLAELGFPDRLISGDTAWGDADPVQMFSGLREQSGEGDESATRVYRWQMIGETSDPGRAIAFLVDVLGSRLERESAAAAAALWRQIGGIVAPLPQRLPGLYRLWDRLFPLGEEESLDPAWWDYPWSGFGSIDMLEDAEELDAVPWDPEQWTRIYRRGLPGGDDPYEAIFAVGLLSRWRLRLALRSPDSVTRALAAAAFLPGGPPGTADGPPPAGAPAPTGPPGALPMSTMIHGTWGWKGDWWRPGRDFHKFILEEHRANLYSGGARFSWSGALSDSQRRLATQDFCEWAEDCAPCGLQTLFAHSYGGEVGARAVLSGTRVDELILLSVPVTGDVAAAARSGIRVVDVRLPFDPVLGLARGRQLIPAHPSVILVLLEGWRYGHDASHNEDVWRQENVAQRGEI
jgi:hypothetical protein